MNIIFFGSSHFGRPCLEALIDAGYNISCVVTQPDKKSGRGLQILPTAIKKIAQEAGLNIYQPPGINNPEAIKVLKDLNPDLFVVIAYGQILSGEVLGVPKTFAINVHASLLPRYRGAAPINWAIINGEKITGITIFKLTPKMDAGPILLQKEIGINAKDTAITLEDKLSRESVALLLESVETIEHNNYTLSPQNEAEVILAPKLKKEDGLIDWNKSAREIHDLVRGCISWPGAFTYYKGKQFKIYKTQVSPSSGLPVCPQPGEIIRVSKEAIIVATAKEDLLIEELQLEGKRIMRAEEFIAGHKILPLEKLGKK